MTLNIACIGVGMAYLKHIYIYRNCFVIYWWYNHKNWPSSLGAVWQLIRPCVSNRPWCRYSYFQCWTFLNIFKTVYHLTLEWDAVKLHFWIYSSQHSSLKHSKRLFAYQNIRNDENWRLVGWEGGMHIRKSIPYARQICVNNYCSSFKLIKRIFVYKNVKGASLFHFN